MSKKDDFKILIEDLLFTYRQFSLNRIGHKKVKTALYRRHRFIWDSVLVSLEREYFIGLARFFDKTREKSKKPKPISVYGFLGYQYKFRGQQLVIKKIIKLRHKWLVHLDVSKMRKWNEFITKEINFRSIPPYKAIEPLFEAVIKVMDKNKIKFGVTKNLLDSFNKEKKEAEKEFNEWVRVFRKTNKLLKKHKKQWVA